jgi:hypothetical protein
MVNMANKVVMMDVADLEVRTKKYRYFATMRYNGI